MSPNTAATTPGTGRRLVASLWAACLAPYVALSLWVPAARAGGFFATVPIPFLVTVSAVAGPVLVALFPLVSAPLPESLDRFFSPSHRRLATLWAIGGAFAVVSMGRIAVYLGDPSRVEYSVAPEIPFVVHHSCLTAYIHGAILSTQPGANVYDMAFVDTVADAPLPPTATRFAPFKLDAFGYPPAFLLLSRSLLWLTADFLSERMLFGAASLVLALFACAAAARTLGGEPGRRLWLLAPLFMASPPVLVTIQVGNFHLAAVAICLLCWVALEQRRDGVTGTLLAIATLAKVFPGLLGVILLMQRRWRAVGFTVLAAAVIGALSLAVLGTGVWRDYLFYQLPRVQSGEALRFMADSAQNIDFNVAPFGLPFKLAALGFSGWGWDQARLFGSFVTPVLLVLAVLAGRTKLGPQHRLTVWLAMVLLGSLRSPFAPPFVLAAFAFLLLVLATEVGSWRGAAAMAAAWATWLLPLPFPNPQVAMAASLARSIALYAFLVWVVVRTAPEPATSVEAGARSPSDGTTPGKLLECVPSPPT